MLREKLSTYPQLNRMTAIIFVFGLCMAVSLSCLGLYLTSEKEIQSLKHHIASLDKTQSPVLAESIWNMDEETLRLQLESIFQHPDIIFIQLDTTADQYKIGQRPPNNTKPLSTSFPIFFTFQGEQNTIGNLTVLASTEQIKHRVLGQVPGIIAMESGKMIIVCLFILIIFHYLFNQHLHSIARFAHNMDFNHLDQPLVLQRKLTHKKPDELDRIVLAINDMRTRLLHGIAEKEQLEEDLRHSQKMEAIGTLAGGIAHDFNNILTAIFGFTELATFHLNDSKKLQDDLEEVRHGADRAKKLVQQILTFSRKSAQTMQPLHIDTVIQEAVKLLRSTLPSTIEIKLHIQKPGLTVLADSTQIHQIIMNIGTNSYHAMRDTGGSLDITLQSKATTQPDQTTQGDVELIISDTGSGMTAETQKKIFEPYFTTKDKGQGTGLGLAVVHGIVKNHRGIITVDSTLNEGTTFCISLPAIQVEKVPVQDEPTPSAAMGNGEHILYVDDEEKILNLAQEIITSYDYKVTTHTDPERALQEFRESPARFDLIVTDMTMPKLTGIEFCAEILKIRADIPILLCSGYSDLVDKDSALELGVREYITKPVVMSKLVHSIHKALITGQRT